MHQSTTLKAPQEMKMPGALLRTARERVGLTQAEVAWLSCVPLHTIQAIDDDLWDQVPAMFLSNKPFSLMARCP